jgi:DNA-binding response OmpR family regulator
MTAIPLRREAPRTTCILELYNTDYALNPYSDRLTSQGYTVVQARTYEEALRLAREYDPVLILVHDDPAAHVDAVRWLEMQHTARESWLAMTPLMILADAARVPELRIHELPDRVIVLQSRADTLNQLNRTVKRLLRLWQLE